MRHKLSRVKFTAPQLAMLRQAYPNSKLEGITEVNFWFANGKIVDCTAAMVDDGDETTIRPGLVRLAAKACRI